MSEQHHLCSIFKTKMCYDLEKHLERNVIEEQYDCQITNCKGTNALSVTYAVNNSSGKYSYLLHTDSDINNVENAGKSII